MDKEVMKALQLLSAILYAERTEEYSAYCKTTKNGCIEAPPEEGELPKMEFEEEEVEKSLIIEVRGHEISLSVEGEIYRFSTVKEGPGFIKCEKGVVNAFKEGGSTLKIKFL